MRIGIDIDDTLTKSSKRIREYIKLFGSKYFDISEYNDNEYEVLKGKNKNELIKKFLIDYSYDISSSVELMENSKEVIDKLIKQGNEIYFISARSNSTFKDPYGLTKKYLEDNSISYDKLLVGEVNKLNSVLSNKIDIMLDDSVDTYQLLNKNGIKCLLFNSNNNKYTKGDFDRINDWLEFYNYIKNIDK